MKFNFRKRYLIFLVVIIVMILFFVLGRGESGLLEIETIAVSKGNIESVLSISGNVQEKKENNVYVETAVKVKDVLVEENENVKKGQKLVSFDMEAMYSNLKNLKINKEILELNYQKATISDEKGMLSLVTTENSTKSAEEAFLRAEALYEVGAISKVEYDNAKRNYDNAKAGLTLSQEGMNYDLEVMKKNIELTGINIENLEKEISKLNEAMYSPADGVISSINMKEGAFVSNATPIYKVVNNNELEIKCDVKEFSIKNLEVGQKVYINGDAIDGYTYEGHIKSIAPIATTVTGYGSSQTIIEVIVDVDSKETMLKAGLNVTCDVVFAESENTVKIPVSAFSEDKNGKTFVYEIVDNRLKSIPVETGIHSDEYLEVVSGLKEGDKIVKNVKSSYRDGLKVTEGR